MKNLLKNFLAMGLIALAIPAAAQNIGLYYPPEGAGTGTVIPALSTNLVWQFALSNGIPTSVVTTNQFGLPTTSTNSAQSVQDYDYCGFTWSYATGSNATVQLYKSFNFGASYELTPTFSYNFPGTNATGFTTNAILDIHGVTTLAVVMMNPGNLNISNNLINFNLKAARVQIQQAGLQPSTAGPVPSITSTNWTP